MTKSLKMFSRLILTALLISGAAFYAQAQNKAAVKDDTCEPPTLSLKKASTKETTSVTAAAYVYEFGSAHPIYRYHA